MKTEAELREQIVKLGKSLFDRGLAAGSAGNISGAVDDGVLITPTNSSLGSLAPAEISKLDREWRLVSGNPPSKELGLHRAFYETRPGTRAVVHLHSSFATAWSCLADVDDRNALPPLTPYAVMRFGCVKLLEYFRPGDPRLEEQIRNLRGRFNAVLLSNHGSVVAGTDLLSAVFAAEELEEAAKLNLILRNMKKRVLTAEHVEELQVVFGDRLR
ncbi:aldolase [Agrobacterium rhizogenes]|uniref:3-oxo-tetronate 4-phosphate decarboxylase n=1 Tax=Rhizobium rhizogenes TaxID=359 RepID=UPI0022B71D4F|nr:3-oxo-tetronate 4-phosphate decarboxylase [Rhizobium rhizogenes]MCZ7447263.1 aldolase [Rhizobium rhizogenes]